jgi:HEAT repeat protein
MHILGLTAIMGLTLGCSPLRGSASIELVPDEIAETAKSQDASRPLVAKVPVEQLRNDTWVTARGQLDRNTPRWMQDAADQVWSAPQVDREDLVAFLDHAEPIVAANSAICLARLKDARASEKLANVALDSQLKLELRRAAVDALGQLEDPKVIDDLRRLIDQVVTDPTAVERSRVYLPELHAELLYALNRHVDAADDPRFAPLGNQLPGNVKAAAAEAWSQGRPVEVPQVVADWRTDVDPRVRALMIKGLAQRRSSHAFQAAKAGLNDSEIEVRVAAIHALGQIGTAESHKSLLPLLQHSGELIRAAAVEAADALGDDEAVRRAAVDKSWRVRSAVADTLTIHPQLTHLKLAQDLVADRSLEVQRQVVLSITAWPTPLAGPVLFSAIEKASYSVKKAALEQLADRWPAAREHSIDLPPERAVDSLAELRRKWRDEFGEPGDTPTPTITPFQAATLSSEQIQLAVRALQQLRQAELDDQLRRKTIDQLISLGPGLLPWLTTYDQETPHSIPAIVYREVLPKHFGDFAALVDLELKDVATRRRVAERLAQGGDDLRLSPLAIERLSQILERENDVLVWRSILRAVHDSDSPAACRLAYTSIAQPSDEVRRLACEHLADHPAVEHAAVLLPVLDDPFPGVVRAAIHALSQPGVLSDPAPLKKLLTATDRRVRIDAAAALVRRNDEAGFAAMERLAFDPDVEVRRRAVQTMGQLERDEFRATLITLLSESQGIGFAAEASLRQIVGPETAERVAAASVAQADRVIAWRRWWEQNQ